MPSHLRGRALTWKARGLSDADDGTNAFPGAMASLQNLVPNPSTRNQWVPRPAATQLTAFAGSGLNTPGTGTGLVVVGNIAYGMCGDTAGAYNGKDVPFAYNIVTNTFEAVSIPRGAASLPASPPSSGDWTPPILAVVGSRILVTHPGFPGGAGSFFGWLDISGFADATKTGNTHSNTTIDGLSANVLQAGWQIGMIVSGAGIPANTTIIAIAANGLSLTLSQAATATANGVALTVAGGTGTAPLWDSGNTNGNALAAVPLAVAQFNGRAYFAVGAGLTFSDAGSPCQVTNATQAITFRNGLNVTALGPVGLYSATAGGVVQSLIAFQGDAQMQQIQGDITFTSGLTVNAINSGVGTLAPLTVTSTPLGLAFVAPDGLRILDASGRISDPIGAYGDGVTVPFIAAISPSRMCAAFNQNVLRVSVKNGNDPNQTVQEYWLDFSLKVWSGPHTFPASVIAPYQGSAAQGFILFASGIAGKLWQSSAQPQSTSSYTENGTALSFTWKTTLLPDNDQMSENAIIESALGLTLPPSSSLLIQATDELGTLLDQVTLTGQGTAATIWGAFNWGNALWGGGSSTYRQYQIGWHQPLVFKQAQMQVNGISVAGLAIGNFYMRYEELAYDMQAVGGRV
jgi:hypothetical protein